MDIMYLPDAIAYPSFRTSSTINSYEPVDAPLWIKPGQPPQQQPQQKATSNSNNASKRGGNHGGSCPLCKERQRRRLATYIRSKSRQDSECTIEEEEEEGDGEQRASPGCKSRAATN